MYDAQTSPRLHAEPDGRGTSRVGEICKGLMKEDGSYVGEEVGRLLISSSKGRVIGSRCEYEG